MDRPSDRKPEDRSERDGSPPARGESEAPRLRRRIFEPFGTLDWDPAYDYKAERRQR